MNPSELLSLFPSKVACAKALGISRRTLYYWIKKGVIPPKEVERIQERLKREPALERPGMAG
jgi:predicted site-specific integrase-resolvase